MISVWRALPIPQKIEEIIAARDLTPGTAAAIAGYLSEKFDCVVSRNSIIGIYDRNVDALLDYPLKGMQGGGAMRLVLRSERLGLTKPAPKPVEPIVVVAPASVRPSLPAIMPLNKTLMELEARECRWPSEDVGPTTFCAHQTHGTSSYCLHHYKRSLGAGMKTERNALRNLSKVA